jgi:YD repeat-containing protein
MMAISGQHEKTIDIDTGATFRTFGYDQDNNLISITDQFGNQTTIQRDSNNIPTSIISPDGLTTQLTIDGDNHLTRITYPGGSHYDFEYTPDGLMTAKVEPEMNRFEHFFDSNGKLTDATDEEGGHWQFSRTAGANGSILSEVLTGEGNLTSYLDHTDSTGEYTSTITGPSGSQTLYNKSANGLIVNKSLPCGMDLEFKYGLDSEYKSRFLNEMIESTPSALEKVTLRDRTYQDTDSDNTPDLITETVMINDKSTTLENNVLQSQKTITSHEGRTVTTLYDPVTLVTERESVPGLFDTTYGYDTDGRLTSVDTNTRGIDLTYNAQGFLESITDPENHTTTYSYDAVGRITQVDRPDISSLWFSYDNNGNMTVLTNPSTINHGFGYNKVNLNSSYQTPISGSYSYLYDKDRRLKQINFPSGNQINKVYANGRLEQIQTPEGNIDFTYLCGTKVGSMTKGSESITYGYDGKLVTSETLSGALNQSISYGYNNDFNLTGLTYAGASTSYLYDNDGLLTGAGSFTITRNAGNGLPESVAGGALSLTRGFNGYGEVEGQDFTVNGQNLTSWNLIRDNNGRITQKTETVDSVISDYVYTYDPMGRLLTVTKDGILVEGYGYDVNGTRIEEMNSLRGIIERSFTYSDEDHLLTAGAVVYSYNLDGFLSAKTEGSDVTTYDYSSRGELLVVTLPDGRIIEYVHDPLGRRITKKIDGVMIEKYLWQGLTRLLAVYDGSDNLLQRFEYADGRMLP